MGRVDGIAGDEGHDRGHGVPDRPVQDAEGEPARRARRRGGVPQRAPGGAPAITIHQMRPASPIATHFGWSAAAFMASILQASASLPASCG